MSAYEELGGASAKQPPPAAPPRIYHKWRFLQQWGIEVQKHVCKFCGITRVKTLGEHGRRCRYRLADGTEVERSPQCTRP